MQSVYAKQHHPQRRRKNDELRIHRQVCRYLDMNYPSVLYRTDGGGLPLSQTQAAIFKSLQHCSGFPDLMILHPKHGKMGLFLELKREDAIVYLKIGSRKGKLSSNPHIQNQATVLNRLNKLGYSADFAIGLDDAIAKIDKYMGNENTSLF